MYGKMHDDSCTDSEDESIQGELKDKTPTTRRRTKEEAIKKKVDKLSPVATYFTLMKGFICASILYLPKSFINGGWGFSVICMFISCFITLSCGMLLLDVRNSLNSTSYTEIGRKLYGSWGVTGVNLALAGSQIGFTCSYIYFICRNLNQILLQAFDLDVSINVLAVGCFVMFSALAFVRKI